MYKYVSRLREYFVRGLIRRGRNFRVSSVNSHCATVIAGDLIIEGSLVSSGDVYLLGHIKGDVTCDNVFFGKRGAVDGAIHVRGRTNAADNQMIGAADVYFK